MKKAVKVLSLILALVMALSVLPVAFAAEDEATAADARVAAWEANYKLLLETVLDDTNYAGYNYVAQNEKAMKNEMNTYTALAFYDDAWKNYATKNVDTAMAEEILLAIIGKAEYEIDNDYLETIIKIVDGVDTAAGYVDKVADTFGADFSQSEDWGTALQIIGYAAKIVNYAGDKKDEFVKAYAQVLSVQMANMYYIDLLQYVVDNATDAGLVEAAKNLIANMSKSLEDVAAEIAASMAEDAADYAVDVLVGIAMDSNVYTATANKIYGGVKTVANVVWGTSNKYQYLYNLKVAAAFQALAAEWTADALANDADKAVVAVDLLINTREVGDEALYNLKKADAETVAGKINSKLYGEVYEDVAIEKASLEIIRTALYGEIADMAPVSVGLYIYCPVSVAVTTTANEKLYTIADGAAVSETNAYGIFAAVKSEYSDEYLKVAYLADNYRVALTGTADGTVTCVMDVLTADGVEDWSFTDLKMAKGYTVVFDTAFEGTPIYTYNNGTFTTGKFNDTFVASAHEKATAKEVVTATIEVGKDEGKSFLDKIKEFFANFLNIFKNLFKK